MKSNITTPQRRLSSTHSALKEKENVIAGLTPINESQDSPRIKAIATLSLTFSTLYTACKPDHLPAINTLLTQLQKQRSQLDLTTKEEDIVLADVLTSILAKVQPDKSTQPQPDRLSTVRELAGNIVYLERENTLLQDRVALLSACKKEYELSRNELESASANLQEKAKQNELSVRELEMANARILNNISLMSARASSYDSLIPELLKSIEENEERLKKIEAEVDESERDRNRLIGVLADLSQTLVAKENELYVVCSEISKYEGEISRVDRLLQSVDKMAREKIESLEILKRSHEKREERLNDEIESRKEEFIGFAKNVHVSAWKALDAEVQADTINKFIDSYRNDLQSNMGQIDSMDKKRSMLEQLFKEKSKESIGDWVRRVGLEIKVDFLEDLMRDSHTKCSSDAITVDRILGQIYQKIEKLEGSQRLSGEESEWTKRVEEVIPKLEALCEQAKDKPSGIHQRKGTHSSQPAQRPFICEKASYVVRSPQDSIIERADLDSDIGLTPGKNSHERAELLYNAFRALKTLATEMVRTGVVFSNALARILKRYQSEAKWKNLIVDYTQQRVEALRLLDEIGDEVTEKKVHLLEEITYKESGANRRLAEQLLQDRR